MKCPKCGTIATDNEKHCPSCGNLLISGSSSNNAKLPSGLMIGIIAMSVILIGILAFFVTFLIVKANSTTGETFPDSDVSDSTTVEHNSSEAETDEQKISIPNFVGMKSDDAYSVLSEQQLLYPTTYDFSDSVPEDYIISQTPPAGNSAQPDDIIILCISRGAVPRLTEPPTAPPEPPTIQVITEKSANSSDYILPYSDSRYLTKSDITWMDKATVELALNEIYARHGRIFKTKRIADYFNSKSWYHGTVDGSTLKSNDFNDYEKKNILLITNYMKEKGYR